METKATTVYVQLHGFYSTCRYDINVLLFSLVLSQPNYFISFTYKVGEDHILEVPVVILRDNRLSELHPARAMRKALDNRGLPGWGILLPWKRRFLPVKSFPLLNIELYESDAIRN